MRRVHLGDDVREVAFAIGESVYLRMCDEPKRGLVVGYTVRPGEVLYAVAWGDRHDTPHYDFELTATWAPEYADDASKEERE